MGQDRAAIDAVTKGQKRLGDMARDVERLKRDLTSGRWFFGSAAENQLKQRRDLASMHTQLARSLDQLSAAVTSTQAALSSLDAGLRTPGT